MSDFYLHLKLLHILSAVIVMGTGTGIAFFMFMASRTNNPQAIYITAKHVILGDWIFTAPAVFTQIVTGIMLMSILGFSFTSTWFYAVLGLFALIGVCWIPVLKIQYRLRHLAKLCRDDNTVSQEFKALMRTWTLLGIPAFIAMLGVFWLMVFKPYSVI
jgi:uncharacterized membrane protein